MASATGPDFAGRITIDSDCAVRINSSIVGAKQCTYHAKTQLRELQHSEAREAMLETVQKIYDLFDHLQEQLKRKWPVQ